MFIREITDGVGVILSHTVEITDLSMRKCRKIKRSRKLG